MTLRKPGNWWRIKQGALELDAWPVALGDGGNLSLLARRQQHLNAIVTTSVRFRRREMWLKPASLLTRMTSIGISSP